MKKKLIVFACFLLVSLSCLPQLPVRLEDGNSQSGVRLSCGIDYTRFRPYGYGWELRRLAG